MIWCEIVIILLAQLLSSCLLNNIIQFHSAYKWFRPHCIFYRQTDVHCQSHTHLRTSYFFSRVDSWRLYGQEPWRSTQPCTQKLRLPAMWWGLGSVSPPLLFQEGLQTQWVIGYKYDISVKRIRSDLNPFRKARAIVPFEGSSVLSLKKIQDPAELVDWLFIRDRPHVNVTMIREVPYP